MKFPRTCLCSESNSNIFYEQVKNDAQYSADMTF